jgi:hypothetical protein
MAEGRDYNRRPALKSHRKPGTPRYMDVPQPGFYRLKLVKRGPWVPARIWVPCPIVFPELPGEVVVVQEGCGECGAQWGVPHSPHCRASMVEHPDNWGLATPHRYLCGRQIWSLRAEVNGEPKDPLYVWQWGYEIGPRDYYRMAFLQKRAEIYEPYAPEANPRAAIDLRNQPSLF